MSLRDELNAAFGDPERFRILIDSNWPAIDAALGAAEQRKKSTYVEPVYFNPPDPRDDGQKGRMECPMPDDVCEHCGYRCV